MVRKTAKAPKAPKVSKAPKTALIDTDRNKRNPPRVQQHPLVIVGAVFCCVCFLGGFAPLKPLLKQPRHEEILCQTTTGTAPASTDMKLLPPLMTDSSNATVMGFATTYGLRTFMNFVGSLRKTGFKGHIILGVGSDIDNEAIKYLTSKQATMAKVEFVPCTHGIFDDEKGKEITDAQGKEARSCVAPYDKLKSRWGRFPFLRDQLKKCEGCTGPVLITDVRDTFFQRDPFGSGQPQVEGLQLFEEHKKQTTEHWLAKGPIQACRGVVYKETMLCSGTTIGTRQSMIDYLDVMHDEMNHWMADKKCHSKGSGDDQSIHNYIYYSGKLPFAKAMPNGLGIVNTVGYIGSVIFHAHKAQMIAQGMKPSDPYEGTTRGTKPWITQPYDVTDEEGYILDHDGKKSAVVHQYDRFGVPFDFWLQQASGLVDK